MTDRLSFNLDDYQWKNRIVVVSTPTKTNPIYQTFMKDWADHLDGVRDRDLLLVHIGPDRSGTIEDRNLTPQSVTVLMDRLDIPADTLCIILVGKDGTVKSKTADTTLKTIFTQIDAMPMRQAEMKQNKTE